MSDTTTTKPRRHKPPRLEYGCYFAVIFLISLPISLLRSVARTLVETVRPRAEQAVREGRARERAAYGFISRAWSEARTVTQLIFSA